MRRVLALAAVLWTVSCATRPPADGPAPGDSPRAAKPPPVPENMTREELFDAALRASGYEHDDDIRTARAKLESFVAPVVGSLEAVQDDRRRAASLLASLHDKGGLLGTYDARATTLRDVIERRHFNCVSASVLYNLLAARLRLDAAAQLLPTHARTLLSLPDGKKLSRVVVETTSSGGFDPNEEAERRILASVAGPRAQGARTLVAESGAVVDTQVLIGIIYVNRASIAQEGGDYERAESLFARGEAFASSEEMRRILRDQRAALLSQLAGDDVASEEAERIRRAYRTLRAAVALEPTHPRVRDAVFHNLRAAAERLIYIVAQNGKEEELITLAKEAASSGMRSEDRSGLRAFALSEVARLRVEAQRYEDAVDALDLALKEQLGPDDERLRETLEQNRVSALRLAAFTMAKRGDYRRGLSFIERIESDAPSGTEVSKDRLRVIHLVGNKRLDDRDYVGAAEVYRDGLRRFPTDETSRHNLVAVLERLVMPMVEAGSCTEAREVLEEIRVVDPKTTFPSRAQTRCLMERARRRLEAKDYPEAVELIRAARKANPNEPAVVQNLAVALLRWASDLSTKGRCREAKRLAKEITSLRAKDIAAREVERALKGCT